MSLYQENMKILKSSSESLYNKIINKDSLYNSKVEEVYDDAGNCVNLVVENENGRCFLHSIYDRERSIEMMYKDVPKDVENLIVFGVGQSTYYISNNFKYLKGLVIIEPDAGLFQDVMKLISLKHMVGICRNHFITLLHKEKYIGRELYDFISNNIVKGISLVVNPSYRVLFEEYYNFFYNEIERHIKDTTFSLLHDESAQWKRVINNIRNYNYPSMLFMEFKGIFDDIPAVLVSAGPSLNYNIDSLRELGDKAFIVAVGTAIRILENHGIKPHMRAAFDPHEEERVIIEGLEKDDIPLLMSHDLYYDIPRNYNGRLLSMISADNYISRYINGIRSDISFRDENPLVFVTASIAISTYHALCKMGFKKIILMGQDLCFTEGKFYAKGSHEVSKEVMDSTPYEEAVNNLGEMVYTNSNFQYMRRGIEEMVRELGVHTINSTVKGLVIEGAEVKDIKKVIDENLTTIYDIKAIIDKKLSNYDFEVARLHQIERLMRLRSELIDIVDINKARMEFIKDYSPKKMHKKSISKLRSDRLYLESIESKLFVYEAYSEVLEMLLKSKFQAFEASHVYNREDEYDGYEAFVKLQSLKSYEIKTMSELMLRELNEIYKNNF